jgi:serpin B
MKRLSIVLFAAAAACTSSKPDVLTARQLPASISGDAAMVVTANNQFAFDVYNQLGSGANTFFSPFSISTAFAMLDAGAAGQTDTEIRNTLHFTLPGDQLHAAYGALIQSIDTGRSYNNYTLATADRLFGQQGFPFLSTFLDTTKNDYEAELQTVDFTVDDGNTARGTINQWVSDQTDAKIPQLFPMGSITPSTVLALANAILFKGTWAQQFDPTKTQTSSFHVANGADVQTPMMNNGSASISLGTIDGGKLGMLPFEGKDLSMVVIVPDSADGLPALEAQLTGASLASAIAGAQMTDSVEVSLPKLTLTEGFSLNQIMQNLGIVTAFDPDTADFAGIDGAMDLYVQNAIHNATITVDEEGAEAAAATGISVGTDGGGTPPPSLIADHSFVLGIYDNVTGSVLFLGRVQDPTQTM